MNETFTKSAQITPAEYISCMYQNTVDNVMRIPVWLTDDQASPDYFIEYTAHWTEEEKNRAIETFGKLYNRIEDASDIKGNLTETDLSKFTVNDRSGLSEAKDRMLFHAQRLCKLFAVNAPHLVLNNEAVMLAEQFVIANYCTDCRNGEWIEGFLANNSDKKLRDLFGIISEDFDIDLMGLNEDACRSILALFGNDVRKANNGFPELTLGDLKDLDLKATAEIIEKLRVYYWFNIFESEDNKDNMDTPVKCVYKYSCETIPDIAQHNKTFRSKKELKDFVWKNVLANVDLSYYIEKIANINTKECRKIAEILSIYLKDPDCVISTSINVTGKDYSLIVTPNKVWIDFDNDLSFYSDLHDPEMELLEDVRLKMYCDKREHLPEESLQEVIVIVEACEENAKDRWGVSAFPLMVLKALNEIPCNQKGLSERIEKAFGITIDRKAISRHLDLIREIGFDVKKVKGGWVKEE